MSAFIIAAGLSFLGCQYYRGVLELSFIPETFPTFLRTISTFGVMLASAFLMANYLIQKEFRRLDIERKIGDNIIIIAVIGGIIGAKLFFLLEVAMSNDQSITFTKLIEYTLQGAGLVWYGGAIVAATVITIYVKPKGFTFFSMGDILVPAIAIGHGLGRLGCMFSGDRCYGDICFIKWIPAPFAMSFENGAANWVYEISQRARHYNIELDPSTAVVYNTPLFETIFGFSLFLFFWLKRKKEWPVGFKFVTFIAIHVTLRFLVEFIRLNEFNMLYLTQAQFLGVIAIIFCIAFFVYRRLDLIKFIKQGYKWKLQA